MKLALLISIAAIALACNGSRDARSDLPPSSTATGSQASASAGTATGVSKASVTLVGCLLGPERPGTVGTAGSAAGERARARAAGADEQVRHGALPNGHFVLSNVVVESGGAGASGAGASGGPLVSAGSSFELDGLPADAQASVNKRVRITGQVDPQPASTGAASGAAQTDRAGAASASPSTTGGTSTRDDVRANSTAVAGDATNRRLTVETVQVVSEECGRQ
jgi:hypothetical protein